MYNLYSSPSASRFIRSLFRLELNLTVTSALEHLSTGKKNGIDLRATVSRETKYDQQKFPNLYTLNAISPRLRPLRCIDYQSSSRRSTLVLFAPAAPPFSALPGAPLITALHTPSHSPPFLPISCRASSASSRVPRSARRLFRSRGKAEALVDESGALFYAPRIDTRAQPCDRCKRYNETFFTLGPRSLGPGFHLPSVEYVTLFTRTGPLWRNILPSRSR